MEEPIHLARKLLWELQDGLTTHHHGRALLEECGRSSLSPAIIAVYILVSILLVIFSGTMAGLTLGLLSIDK